MNTRCYEVCDGICPLYCARDIYFHWTKNPRVIFPEEKKKKTEFRFPELNRSCYICLKCSGNVDFNSNLHRKRKIGTDQSWTVKRTESKRDRREDMEKIKEWKQHNQGGEQDKITGEAREGKKSRDSQSGQNHQKINLRLWNKCFIFSTTSSHFEEVCTVLDSAYSSFQKSTHCFL